MTHFSASVFLSPKKKITHQGDDLILLSQPPILHWLVGHTWS